MNVGECFRSDEIAKNHKLTSVVNYCSLGQLRIRHFTLTVTLSRGYIPDICRNVWFCRKRKQNVSKDVKANTGFVSYNKLGVVLVGVRVTSSLKLGLRYGALL